jgi:hypothetical protein
VIWPITDAPLVATGVEAAVKTTLCEPNAAGSSKAAA